MNTTAKSALITVAALLMVSGCKKTADNTSNFKTAINTYYSAHPACLWPTSQQFPVQVGASDTVKAAPFAALLDQGLLVRTSTEKKIILFSKQEINYDLSDKGRSAWTADATQPGYGNFCYGTRSVSSIDATTPTTDQPGATTSVTYHYTIGGPPAWATAPETQNAFPQVAISLTGGAATATLLNTSNGWQMQTPAASSSAPATSADGKIVE